MPSKGPTQRERFEKEREEWSQRNRTMQFGSKELKEVLCNNMTAVGSLFQIWDENGDGVISQDEIFFYFLRDAQRKGSKTLHDTHLFILPNAYLACVYAF